MKPIKGQTSPWGNGAVRAMVPTDLGGPFGNPSQSLPTYSSSPAYYGYPGYSGSGVYMKTVKSTKFGKRSCSFGSRSMTSEGVTTEKDWGLTRKYGKSHKRFSKKRKSVKRKRFSKKRKSAKRKRFSKKRKSAKRKSNFGQCPMCKSTV